ncbi:MAG TPA: hypothetical protein VIS10_10675, partial [Anaerolineales bacterium]
TAEMLTQGGTCFQRLRFARHRNLGASSYFVKALAAYQHSNPAGQPFIDQNFQPQMTTLPSRILKGC